MQPLPQEEDAPVVERRLGRGRLLVAGVVVLGCGAALGTLIALAGARKAPDGETEAEVFHVVGFEEEEVGDSMIPKCVDDRDTLHEIMEQSRLFDWLNVSAIDGRSQEAILQAIELLQGQRKACEGVPALPFEASDFEEGAGHHHRVRVHHKYGLHCAGSAFKLHFYTESTAEASMSFVVHLFQDTKTKAWQLLRSSPPACEIKAGQGGYPEPLSPWSALAQEKAKFAISELAYRMKKLQCLASADKLHVDKIEHARTTVGQGLVFTLEMTLSVVGSGRDPFLAKLVVLEACGMVLGDECVNELVIPKETYADACAVMSGKQHRRLAGPNGRGLGHIPPDPTEVHLSQRALLEPARFLAETTTRRPPMELRHITQGEIPESFDNRGDDCFRLITVYDQGSCGSCYAQAVAQMIGIRSCLLAKKAVASRRRLANSAAPSKRKTRKGCACKTQWTWQGRECTTGCCNPSNSASEWCVVEDAKCEEGASWGWCEADTPQAACADSTAWTDISGDGCDWYKANDNGCKKYKDYGQRTHCKATCNTCPSTEPKNDDGNPWKNALYKYMPSVNDLAQCATYQGKITGCDGGNAFFVWEGMRDAKRNLHLMGQSCKPYTLKCWKSDGVVNPLSGGKCDAYNDYEKWHKPCSCISSTDFPKSYSCPTDPPQGNCGIEVPPRAFNVATMANGLNNKQAVENIQRHIKEYGPVYIAFSVSNAFMDWPWQSKPVYTGGKDNVGGHAVMAVGWGKLGSTDYWLIRNSWGASWADRGYCKFQRGINLDGIEEQEVAAFIPDTNFKDMSPPTCRLEQYAYTYGKSGTTLTKYDMSFTFKCSEDATVDVYVKSLNEEDQDRQYSWSAKKAKSFKVTADLKCLGYGLRDARLSLTTSAKDTDGNVGKSTNSLTIKGIKGMTDLSEC